MGRKLGDGTWFMDENKSHPKPPDSSMTMPASATRQPSENHNLGRQPLGRPSTYLLEVKAYFLLPNKQHSSWALKVRRPTVSSREHK